ncbi:efflux RND transporter periplasmic adaptor subunit [Rhodalgimonas zhirmunskyi]|uniref:Efflux RND transporter periplasmic adaptor subunit n=1 Tax=Rhodalgimonas zhirmunskyi TaxID=2964767 RepID=A0AAJ1X825_9RHOB|nr:efflux RND transporter periplasmic adaptor subunit [Rhodoalgimonas zhirmunskyi]MDQ2095167.1 efflux RND transporter periplasmic adaptor subunit [Rhodoalgimonas zhirmunskyi]
MTAAFAETVGAPAVVRAEATAIISSVVSGRINELPYEEGAEFKEGDVLARIDCAVLDAETEALRAEKDAAFSRSNSLQRLLRSGGIGKAEVEAAEAMSLAAEAKLTAAKITLKGCVIEAPFDGKLSEYSVNRYEFVEQSKPMFSIVSSGKPELEIIAPDTWLRWIAVGKTGQIQLDAAVGTYEISVTGVAPVVDPVSRTVKLSAVFTGNASGILPGMSGRVLFEDDR